MNKIILAAAALLATAATASASDVSPKSDFQGFYMGVVSGVSPILDGYDPAWSAGVTLGYNWEVADGFILGLEGDLTGGMMGDFGYANDSIRLRAGYDFDGLLIYGTAGIGATAIALDTAFGTFTDSAAGFVGGGGAELMLGNGVSLKAEGLYRGDTESFEFRTGINFNF
jgi:opacity protein-like surface antigen